jgi:hypothetical protein
MQTRDHSVRVNQSLLARLLSRAVRTRALPARVGQTAAFGLVLALAAGCGGTSSAKSTTAKAISCGQSKTAANVPVHIEIVKGQFTCQTALAIEHEYASAIRSGHAPGNGGGGPLKIDGWTCQGFSTPIVLHTGKASKCVKGTDEILALLPASA